MTEPLLSILLPAYNESASIVAAVEANTATGRSLNVPFEVVAIDDGSADNTRALLAALEVESETLRVVCHDVNRGFGAALRTGLQNARGEFCIVAPADSPLTADMLTRFLAAARDADLVIGVRDEKPGYSLLMRFNSRLYHFLLKLVCGLPYTDVNWIHLYRRRMFETIDIEFSSIAMGAEMVLKTRALGLRIKEVPCTMQRRMTGQASARKFRVMLRTGRDLLILLWRWAIRRQYRQPGRGLLSFERERQNS